MRQASWEEMWRAGDDTRPPEKPPWYSKLAIFSWEELVTLAIVMVAFVSVVQSIDSADWVPEMPSLYGTAFLGLFVGLALSRLRIYELFIHILALGIGSLIVLNNASANLAGARPDRIQEIIERTRVWSEALIGGGISNDNLPFVLIVVGATYLTAYLSAWAIFRWYNAWVALIPGGLALLTNISYLPGQRSFSLLIYLFCAILLVARVNVLRQQREWRDERTAYPELISLHVLNVTVWVGLVLLAAAWILPVGSGSGLLFSLWEKATAPVAEPLSSLGRVFSNIDSKKGGTIHQFGAFLPLQGEISLTGSEVMTVTAAETGFLRAQSYDVYTAQGWKIGANTQITTAWPALKAMQTPDEARRQLRRPVSITVETQKNAGVIVTAGEPLAVNVDTRVVFGADPTDVTSIRPSGQRLNKGTQYRVDSTVSNASVGRLRTSGAPYPTWVTNSYLQLPADLPRTIGSKARDVTSTGTNAYDRATQIEAYLRTIAVDTEITPAPPKRDSVEYFLFTLQRGYFDYHASAMVVLLRTLGIPSRLAVGYIIRPIDRVPDTNTYVVAEGNAFAWPEVYFPGLGWVEFNPTPSEARITRTGSDDQEFSNGGDDEVLDEELDSDFVPTDTEPAPDILDQLQTPDDSSLIGRIIFSIVFGFLALSLAIGGAFQYSWQRGLGGLDYPVQVWEKTMRLARWARIRATPQETPRELMTRLHRELPEVDDLDYLGESFIRSRYGRKDLGADEKERLAGVWKQVRNNLLGRILRWR